MPLLIDRSRAIDALDPTPAAAVAYVDPPAPRVHDRALKTAPRPTHPDCTGCCALALCHWCIQPARGGRFGRYQMLQWTDGYWYGACEDHARDLLAAVEGDTAPGAII